jgi:RHS repeat-associated protein
MTTLMGTCSTVYNGKTNTVTTPESITETTMNNGGQTITSKVNGKIVTYTYYASGLIKNTCPEGGQAIAMEYNLQGKRIKLTDPDAGIVESTYNGFGNLIEEKQKIHNATNYITTTNSYASNGLLQSIVRNGETTTYTYDTNNRVSTIEINGKNKQTFSYDGFDRINNVREEIGLRIFNTTKEYDFFGRVKKEVFPTGFYTVNIYDSYSNLIEVKDKTDRSIWKVNAENARGQLTSINKGSKETTFGFDSRGLPTSIVASGVENMAYSFDTKGNLSHRTDNLTNQNEQFTYDGMNRLTNWDVYQNGALAKQNSITFDATTSNITAKSDLGAFTMSYGGKRPDGSDIGPHALATISGVPASFPTADLNVTYTDFKKIATLSEGTKYYALTYGVDDQRRKSEYYANGLAQGTPTLTRYYLGNYEEEVNSLGNVRKIHYLSGGAMLIQNSGSDSLLYAYSDFQGSLIALTDVSGNVVEKYAYDPWGARRDPNNWMQKDTRTKWITNRGYTGHEHLDAFGIINMNGRVYDPATAMFMSPDPYVQAPDNWLNYNRYGYCMSNPFKYTDPTGENFLKFLKGVAQFISVIVVYAVASAVAFICVVGGTGLLGVGGTIGGAIVGSAALYGASAASKWIMHW